MTKHIWRFFGARCGPLLLALWAAAPAWAGTTWYVRPDGGTAQQCTGQKDAAYPGSGLQQACAWSHPMIALPSDGQGGGQPLIGPGDTLEISPDAYMIGFGAPGAERCFRDAAWDCRMSSPPGGLSADQPTRIVGKGGADCARKPVLWGTQRNHAVLSLKRASHLVVQCLEITDHSDCVANSNHPMRCQSARFPFGEWASVGLWIEDVKDLTLRDLDIHGMANGGVVAGRVDGLLASHIRIAGNPMAGWDGELYGQPKNSGYTGRIVFENLLVEWNGCSETYPEGRPVACFGQSAGGYGDGMVFARTGGDFLIRNSTFRFNTSDGLDLLYHTLGGSVRLEGLRAEGNAGNQIKAVGAVSIVNSLLLGNCGFFKGQAFTHNVDHCRAMGDTLVLGNVASGEESFVVNNTIVAGGNVTLLAGGPADSRITMRNNVVIALANALYPKETSADVYCAEADGRECAPWPTIDRQYDTVINTRNRRAYCSNPGMRCLQGVSAPYGLTQASTAKVEPSLPADSPHRRSGIAHPAVPPVDLLGHRRPTVKPPDRGAIQRVD